MCTISVQYNKLNLSGINKHEIKNTKQGLTECLFIHK